MPLEHCSKCGGNSYAVRIKRRQISIPPKQNIWRTILTRPISHRLWHTFQPQNKSTVETVTHVTHTQFDPNNVPSNLHANCCGHHRPVLIISGISNDIGVATKSNDDRYARDVHEARQFVGSHGWCYRRLFWIVRNSRQNGRSVYEVLCVPMYASVFVCVCVLVCLYMRSACGVDTTMRMKGYHSRYV